MPNFREDWRLKEKKYVTDIIVGVISVLSLSPPPDNFCRNFKKELYALL